ncbi:hypothetical protein [Pseudomonas sp. EZ-C24]|uniref:hypothetical protein n=1 Tax=Pseudomonas sp. EZ-C24 TaxID=2753617 RepID=UPI001CB72550|nr:hypothetical protein [Pseudomonas sp. EZ-C24]
MSDFKTISKNKFDAYFYGRSPFVKQFTEEKQWYIYETPEITLLAVVLLCKIDNDYNAIVLGRDLNRRFRPVDTHCSLPTPEAAMAKTFENLPSVLASAVDGLIPQGDEASSPFAIFAAKVPAHKRNRYLKMLLDDPTYYPARVAMEELAHWFKDPDGIFIRGLQGNEFNSRLFELYLHATFYELDFIIDHSNPQPDYLLSKHGQQVAVEAVTVAEMDEDVDPDTEDALGDAVGGGDDEDASETLDPRLRSKGGKRLDKSTLKKLLEHVEKELPFRFQRTLAKKVRHRPEPLKVPYWELPHTKGKPFVIAVHDYSKTMSMAMSSSPMQKFLYGLELVGDKMQRIERHEYEGRTIASNFFGQPGNRHVSAVMLVSQATVPKFNRMGRIAGVRHRNSLAIVNGVRTNSEGEIGDFRAVVEDPRYGEAWHDGIFMFHNPNAAFPLDPQLFHRVIHCFERDGQIVEWFPPNYVVSSITEMHHFSDEAADEIWQNLEPYLGQFG